MAKGFSGYGGGMPNMNNMMKQAQKMQKQMADAQKQMEEKQAELAEQTLSVTSGGGAIEVVITGKKEIREIKLDKDVVDPDDVEMLQDLILTAVNEAIRQADALYESEMGKITGGLGALGNMGGLGGLF